jgi:signal transduction histidine kinase
MARHSELGETTALGRRKLAREMPPGAVALRWGVAFAGVALLAYLNFTHPSPTSRIFPFLLFVTLIVLADGLLFVRVAPGSYFTWGTTFLFAFFLLYGGLAAASLDAFTRLIVWGITAARGRKQRPLFVFFSVGQSLLAVLAGAWAVELIFRRPAVFQPVANAISTLLVFATVYLLVSTFLSSVAVWARAGYREVRTQLWPTVSLWSIVSVVTSVPFALFIIYLRPTAGTLGLFLVFTVQVALATLLWLYVGLRSGNDELKAINRISTLLNASLETSQLFKILARETRKVLQWDGFFVALVNDSLPDIDIVFMTGTGDEIVHRTIPKRAGLTGKAIATGELVHYERSDESSQPDIEDSVRGRGQPRSIVVAPMKFGDSIIGALSVQSLQSDAYGLSQRRLLQTLAGQAAIAIRNAQLFESEQRARLERDEFLSLVTHEIKNPLTSITGYTEFAEDAVKNNDAEGALESLTIVRSEARRILRLAEDLLDASRMTAGRFSVQMEQVDLPAIVAQIANRYAVTTGRDIAVDVPRDFPRVVGDSMRLSQVVENLISNAVKYSPERSPIRISLHAEDSRVLVSVSDQGPGISREKIPLIFERFYRVEENGTVVKGTGLGLFITREIVKMHGGSISVNSKEGEGSTFTVQLPRQADPVSAETIN